MSQPFLFYSERCPNSQQIIATLKGLNKTGLYKFILVETIPRNQIPSFLKAVPTLYNPETKDVIVGKDIYGYIAKPTNARKEIPQKETANGPSAQISGPIGDLSPWGFEGMGRLTESYSMWDAPSTFASGGGSNYTFLDGSSFGGTHGGAELPGVKGPDTQNTIKEKTGSNDDVKQRMEMMQKQREKEFAGVERK
jgi:prepilin-type processing-associated H-X9-DG protein